MAVISSRERKGEAPIPGTDPRDEPPAELPPVSDEVAANPVFQAAQKRYEEATGEPAPTAEELAAEASEEGEGDTPTSDPGQDQPAVDPDQEPTDDETTDPEQEETQVAEPETQTPQAGELPTFTYSGIDPTTGLPYTQEYDPTAIERAVQLDRWAQNLPDWAGQAIDALFSGQYQLVPVGQAPPQAAPVQESSVTGVPGQGSGAVNDPNQPNQIELTEDDLADLPPAIAATIRSLNDRVAELGKYQESQAQAQQRQANEAIQAGLLEGQARFQTQYELNDQEIAALQAEVIRAQVLPVTAQQYPGQPAMAMEKAMETYYWSTPQWRDRELGRIARNGNQDPNVTDITRSKQKARKASALGGSGGNGASREQPATPATKEGRKAAMIAEVRDEMFGTNG